MRPRTTLWRPPLMWLSLLMFHGSVTTGEHTETTGQDTNSCGTDGTSACLIKATALMFAANNLTTAPTVVGTVTFVSEHGDSTNNLVTVHVSLQHPSIAAGRHGFHIHDTGDLLTCNGVYVDDDFNPFNVDHGHPKANNRHLGDLGNVKAGPGHSIDVSIKDRRIWLHGAKSIIGRMAVLHVDQDDLAGSWQPEAHGNAGRVLACGVIGIASRNYRHEVHGGASAVASTSGTLVIAMLACCLGRRWVLD